MAKISLAFEIVLDKGIIGTKILYKNIFIIYIDSSINYYKLQNSKNSLGFFLSSFTSNTIRT